MDWIQLLDDHNIPWVSRGPNTKRGEVSIQCPFCGDDDPSEHLGINLTAENWGCLRNAAHRGHSLIHLVSALLKCSYAQARLVIRQYSTPDPNNLDQALASLIEVEPLKSPTKTPQALALPPEARQIKPSGPTARFWCYLKCRGFDDPSALAFKYGLLCATSGRWKDRIIIPFYQNGELLGWTGRALQNPVSAPRYLSSSETVKTTVLNEDYLRVFGGDTLIVVEGPFDALKLDYYSPDEGVRATCIFGTSMTMDQICILNELRKRFAHVVILFDPDAVEPSFNAKDWILGSNIKVEQVPDGIDDPGAMSSKEVRKFIRGLVR